MNRLVTSAITFALVLSSGCALYPKHYTTGTLKGRVVDAESEAPLANALVLANLQITFKDGMSGQVAAPKSIKTAYCLTDTNGTFSMDSLKTTYLHFATVMRSRDAHGSVIGAYLPEFELSSMTQTNGEFEIRLARAPNSQAMVRGLNFVLEVCHRFRLRENDRDIFAELYRPHIDAKNMKKIK